MGTLNAYICSWKHFIHFLIFRV